MRARDVVGVAAAIAVLVALGGCSRDVPADPTQTSDVAADASGSPATSDTAVDPEDVPPDTTDYSADAGNSMPTYTYEPEPEPADSVVATLCNLNQEFFLGLRTEVDGEPVASDELRTNLVGLGDLIDEWVALRRHYPEVGPQIDRAQGILTDWESALAYQEDGDDSASAAEMAKADEAISGLPITGPVPEACAS